MTALYYLATVLCSATQSVFTKRNGRAEGDSRLYLFLRSAVACVFFLAMTLFFDPFHVPTVRYGLIYGILLTVATLSGYFALKCGPMGLTSALVAFSLVIPLFYGVFVLREVPGVCRVIGLILILPTVLLMNYTPKKKEEDGERLSAKWWALVLLTLVCNGFGSLIQKQQQTDYPGEGKATFLCVAMLVSTVIFGIGLLTLIGKSPAHPLSCLVNGGVSGVANGMTGFLTLTLSAAVASSVLFPVISVATLASSLLCGWLFFREKIPAVRLLGVGIGAIAIVLLQL